MIALPWIYLALLSLGYSLALIYGHLGWLAAISFGLLLIAGFAVRQQQIPLGRYL
ncbi:CPBP family intramembrane metalloprotease, partial [Pseudomonas sp. FW305-BF6]